MPSNKLLKKGSYEVEGLSMKGLTEDDHKRIGEGVFNESSVFLVFLYLFSFFGGVLAKYLLY